MITRIENRVSQPSLHQGSSAQREGGSFREILRSSLLRVSASDGELARLVSAGAAPMDSRDLLRLQATVYRTTHELELFGRLVDKGAQAVKSTLQSQS